ncbi:MAG: ATP phosphoribosyltransferase regulatory subunit [Cardiobacteriaceae bacterium]|nr:ATP phosphoribosyltransferase regulatory subunit [Cardiobacteriaceae bacterium]
MTRYWMLPDDVIELLPQQAAQFEALRRTLHDTMAAWGYRFVMPPLVEFLDSLLAGSGSDLDRQTFKLTDQASGRLMGVRADMTPQIARIDAHRLPTAAESRYAYIGEVLRTTSESTEPRRNPWIAGAELYGVADVSGDIEIMALLLDVLDRAGVADSVLDIGHAGIYAGLLADYAPDAEDRALLHDLLAGKRRPDLWQWQGAFPARFFDDIAFLTEPRDAAGALDAFAAHFAGRNAHFRRAHADMESAMRQLQRFFPAQRLSLDFSSVGRYGYHSGLMFACYAPGLYSAIARGGRYDGVGEVYGRARAATGFSLDVLDLQTVTRAAAPANGTESRPMPQGAEAFAAAQAARRAGQIIRFHHPSQRDKT